MGYCGRWELNYLPFYRSFPSENQMIAPDFALAGTVLVVPPAAAGVLGWFDLALISPRVGGIGYSCSG